MSRRKGIVHVIKDLCKGCGLCVWICPVKVLTLSNEVNKYGWRIPKAKEGCIACRLCETYCPDMAIWVEEVREL